MSRRRRTFPFRGAVRADVAGPAENTGPERKNVPKFNGANFPHTRKIILGPVVTTPPDAKMKLLLCVRSPFIVVMLTILLILLEYDISSMNFLFLMVLDTWCLFLLVVVCVLVLHAAVSFSFKTIIIIIITC